LLVRELFLTAKIALEKEETVPLEVGYLTLRYWTLPETAQKGTADAN